MSTAGQQASGRWADLLPRVLSAIVMVVVGASAIWAGGIVFAALVLIATALMVWELSRMTYVPGGLRAPVLAAIALTSLAAVLLLPAPLMLPVLALPALAGISAPRRDRLAFFLYVLAIMATGYGLVFLRESFGVIAVLWILAVVVASDVLGYFAGRLLGGPKFWPRISPKKTWSGTIAGWIGAALVGFGLYAGDLGGAGLIWISPLVAFAGQLGDIAESAIKRRAGVKDSSNLIPGHGGLLDRFDALVFAVVLVTALVHLTDLPLAGGL